MAREEQPDLIEAAAAWLVALDSGSGDRAAFERWRAADPRHAAAFAQVAATWSRLGSARGAMPVQVTATDISRRRWMQAASAVLALGMVGVGTRAVARSSAETAIGERRTIRCDDGLRLDLNTDTAVAWRSAFGSRQLWLDQGEMALEFAAGPAVALSAGDHRVQCQPGSYNARLLSDGALDMLVLRGQATASGASATAGQRLVVDRGGARALAAGIADRDRAEAWLRGELAFTDQPLATAVADYNRYLTTPLQIDDPGIGDIRLGGRFTSRDATDFLAALAASFDLRSYRQDGRILIARAKKRAAE